MNNLWVGVSVIPGERWVEVCGSIYLKKTDILGGARGCLNSLFIWQLQRHYAEIG